MTDHARRATAVDLVAAAADVLKARKDEINKLNVFPVPDGDTGINMSLTMDAVMSDLNSMGSEASLAETCKAIQHGSLMGARGNSGVILSQILRGLCDVVGRATELSPCLVADALDRATTVAYQAVRKPVEGTMLTVLKDTANVARTAVEAGSTVDELLDAVVQAAFESVRRGPELLPVLKENGVVDAGGFGLAILAEGFVAGMEGHEFKERHMQMTTAPLMVEVVDDWDDGEYLYCTEFLLFGTDAEQSFLEEWVASRGGSELIVGDSDLYKIHVHTNDPGSVIAWATSLGEVGDVHINNMRRQTAERTKELRKDQIPTKPLGFVAVAAGAGMAEILRSLGVDEIVSGGQTMNPSTAELLAAAEKVDAKTVIILPNNKNIVMAAQQVADVFGRPLRVVPTTSVPEAFAALLAVDVSASLDDIVEAMTEAASEVKSGEVTTAIKDSKGKVGPIKAGQVIGITDHEIEVVGDDVVDVTVRLVGLLAADAETLTILAGEDLTEEELILITAAVEKTSPGLEIETHIGGQPLYPVVLAVE
ncbi:MAG: DAK2 domain-containing protein [Coriobacteriia bacterium]|nr:DAK2 domain-containing protein [Coriobacteriia bacterium]